MGEWTLLQLWWCIFTITATVIVQSAHAQLTISATTPSPSSDPNTPNTFIGTMGDEIASSLFDSTTPAMMWGIVSSDDINAACQLIVDTGTLTITASLSDWGDSEDLTFQVQDTGGCLAAPDASGTELLFTDNYGRQSAVVCPLSDAGSTGCGVYITGDDINDLYNGGVNGGSGNSNNNNSSMSGCERGAEIGAVTGAISGILDTAGCLDLGPEAPFCVAGVLGVSAVVGAANGCINSCFPADASVQTHPHGTFKRMSQLQIGDKVAVWGHDNSIMYEEIYAFGHKDPNVNATFLRITIQPLITKSANTTTESPHIHLRLTHMHFLPTANPTYTQLLTTLSLKDAEYKRAQDVEVGDILWATVGNNQAVTPCIVKEISLIRSQGLYNPFTLSGTLIVDGVVASAHSDWFLDSTFDMMGLTNQLPYVYQSLLAPIRLLYYVLPKHAYVSIYQLLDASLDVATLGTYYGAHITIATVCGMIASLLVTCKIIGSKTA